MKKTTTFLSGIVILIGLNLVFQFCSKENVEPSALTEKEMTSEQIIVKNIHPFLEQAQLMRSGTFSKSGNLISFDSAVYYIDVCFNYAYGFHTSPYGNMILDTSVISIPLNTSGLVVFDDVIAAYNDVVDSVRSHYVNINSNDKNLLSIITRKLKGENNQRGQLMVISQTGIGSPHPGILNSSGFFSEDAEYWYKRDSWKCDNSDTTNGAPNILESEIWFKYKPAVPPGYRVWFHSVECYNPPYSDFQIDSTPDNYCDYRMFFAGREYGEITDITKCLDYNQDNSGIHEMDFYLEGAEYILNNWLDSIDTLGKSFQNCFFNHEVTIDYLSKYYHTEQYYFGFKLLSKIDHKYPAPIN